MSSEYLLVRWRNVRAGLLDTLDKFRDEELDFKPYAAAWSVRQLMLHIAHEEHGEFAYGIVQMLMEFPPEYDTQAYPTLAAINSLLESVHAQTLNFFDGLQDADLDRVITTPWGATYRLVEMIDHLIEHEVHHRAELSLILGMLGREGFNA
jgi:uncharacterized damage-inducible protein DinB